MGKNQKRRREAKQSQKVGDKSENKSVKFFIKKVATSKVAIYIKQKKANRLSPLLGLCVSTLVGMLVSPVIGAICLVTTVYLALVILVPWKKLTTRYHSLASYVVPLILCILVAFPLWDRLVDIFPGKPQSSSSVIAPTFIDTSQEVIVSLGKGGASGVVTWEALKNGTATPIYIEGLPLKIYINNRQVFVDISIYGDVNNSLIAVQQNDVKVIPLNWDKNSDQNAFEVVNEKQEPIFQLIYETPFHIVLNGIFPYSGGMIYANTSGMSINDVPKNFHLDRIFKYPSKDYPQVRR